MKRRSHAVTLDALSGDFPDYYVYRQSDDNINPVMYSHFARKLWVLADQVFFLLCLSLVLVSFLYFGDKESGTLFLKIINAHEHIESEEAALRYLGQAKKHQITKTVILGSPEATLVPGKWGFAREDENNRAMLRVAGKYPGEFIVFPTINPENSNKLWQFEEYVRLGAKGLKLYSGHPFFHRRPLDDASMRPIYDYCERAQIPILFHVNTAFYQQEFENVLKRFPRLKVICPHFCLSTIRLDRFDSLMSRYPNLYTDISFGFIDFLKEALLRFQNNRQSYRALVLKYQDRILFGLDLTVTREPYKTAQWIDSMMQVYRDFLEKNHFYFFDLPNVSLRGLDLDIPVLEKIYFKNFDKLISKHGSRN